MSAGATLGRIARRKARLREFKNAKPVSETEIRAMVEAHMRTEGVVVCPPAYLAKTQALDLRKK